MQRRVLDAIHDAYRRAKAHLMDELPDRTPVQLLVVFSLGDLRRLDEVSGDAGKPAGDAAPGPRCPPDEARPGADDIR
jgi:hypothetical protein